jgi:dipeptidyl aminopeptidase/acylaminoacyl peptidase
MRKVSVVKSRKPGAGTRTLFGNLVPALIAILAIAAAGVFANTSPDDTLIPRRVLFADDDRLNVRLSPDGRSVSYLAPAGETLGLWLCPVNAPEKAQLILKPGDAPVMNPQWSFTSRHILYLRRVAKDIHLFALELDSGHTRDLTPRPGVSARIEKLSPEHPDELLVGLNGRDPLRYDLHRLNLRTGEIRLVRENDGYQRFLCDDELRPRVAVRQNAEEGYELFRLNAADRWELLDSFTYDQARISQPAALDKKGNTLYLIDNRRINTGVLEAIDLATGKRRTLVSDPLADIRTALFFHPKTGRLQSASAVYGRVRRYFLDSSIAPDFRYLKTIHTGDVGVAGRSLDDSVWLVVFQDGGPLRFYCYDRRAHRATFLFNEQNAVEPYRLARRQAVVVPTRDGLRLPGDLYLPSWTHASNGRYLEHPLPMLVYVHGGPSAAYDWNSWYTNRTLQLLANRGYVVFRVEFRGADGFGKKILRAGAGEWGRKMQADVLDAVDWAVRRGLTERDRVGIWGWSYGGYATLAALSFTPDAFACGLAMYAPTELLRMMETRTGAFRNFWRRQVGDDSTAEGRALLKARSPVYFTDRITRPLLITHGGRDANVSHQYADDLVTAMKRNKKPVTYLLYPDEGHDYASPESWISFFAVAERFFHEHLGGRYEPIGDDLNASNFQVIEGGNLIPDLAGSVKAKAKSPSGGHSSTR